MSESEQKSSSQVPPSFFTHPPTRFHSQLRLTNQQLLRRVPISDASKSKGEDVLNATTRAQAEAIMADVQKEGEKGMLKHAIRFTQYIEQ